jgi:hypothetical protein
MNPRDFVGETPTNGGVVYEYKNDTPNPVQCEYASLTAPEVIRCEIKVDDKVVDVVYAGRGGSHSWWSQGGGRLLSKPLPPGAKLTVRLSGQGAFRIDWY